VDIDLRQAIGDAVGSPVRASRPMGGGDVAESHRVDLEDGRRVFAKTHRRPPPGFFTTEAAGLRWLGEPGVLPVPPVLAVSDGDPATGVPAPDRPPYLVLGWIDEGQARAGTEAELGRALADLHATGAPSFGRGDRRTTGSRGLPNERCATWASSTPASASCPWPGWPRTAAR
jgi:fructosamine-3-kinase